MTSLIQFLCFPQCILSVVIIFLSILWIYLRLSLGIYKGIHRLDGKTVIVTGGSAGIGAESAKEIARRGARILILCRDLIKGENVKKDILNSTGNNNIVVKYIDFASLASVRKCAREILNEEKRIDVLLNNAGVGINVVKLHEQTVDGLNKMMQTNYFGPFLLTNLLLGRLKDSAPSRIVNVSSLAHRIACLDLNDLDQKNVNYETIVYSNTKLANIYFTNILSEKLKGTGVTANSLHPGVVATAGMDHTFKLINKVVLQKTIYNFYKTPWEGAQTSIFLCVCPLVGKESGKFFSDCKLATTSCSAKDFAKAERLWDLSEKAVKLQDSEKHL